MAVFQFPLRDTNDQLSELPNVVRAAESMDADARAVATEVGFRLLTSGCETFGDAVAALENMSPEVTRRLVNDARASCGLETFEAVEAEGKRQAAMRAVRPDPRLQMCGERSCDRFPQTASGSWRAVEVRQWWCHEHKHLAGPDDDKPPEPEYFIDPRTGGERLNPRSETARRLKEENAKRREEEAALEEQRRREAAALAEVRRRYEREAVVSFGGIRCHPYGRVVP